MEQSSAQVVRSLYRAINQGDEHGIGACFAEDAAWHGSSQEVRGRDAITRLIGDLVAASDGSLAIELHDVVASEAHVVALQTTRAVRAGRRLEDRVVYVFHVADGRINHAWFSGDPRVQDEFWAD